MGMRKCSQCGKTGHNSRTCRSLSRSDQNGPSMKLFGVELANLPLPVASPNHHFAFKNSFAELLSPNQHSDQSFNHAYFSNATPQAQRKKGVPWSEEEHRLFLMGLEKLGKGNWRGISRNFVTTRTSTQVASHAQKYFLRQNNANRNKNTRDPLSTVKVNEAQSISVGIFSTADCIYTNTRPINPAYTLPEIPFKCRFFNNSTPQNTPSLELSLAAPPLPPQPLAWNRRSIVLCTKQYVV